MQKGEGLHRCGWIGGFLLVCLAITGFPLEAYPVLESAAWISGRGGAGLPSENVDIVYDLREKTFFGFISSCSNPYGIDDLVTADVRLGLHSHTHSIWAGWMLIYYPLYREDRFSLDCGVRFMKSRVLFEVVPALSRRSIGGFPAESAHKLSLHVACRCTEVFDTGIGAILTDRDFRSRAVVKLSLRRKPFVLAFNYLSRGTHPRDIRVGAEVELDPRLTLLCGYRTGADEISGGVLVRFSGFLIGFSWRHHAALGKTFSISIGRLWVR